MKNYVILLILFIITFVFSTTCLNATEVSIKSSNGMKGKGLLVQRNGIIGVIAPEHVVSNSTSKFSCDSDNKDIKSNRYIKYGYDTSVLSFANTQILKCMPSTFMRLSSLDTVLNKYREGVLNIRKESGGIKGIPVIITDWGSNKPHIEIRSKEGHTLAQGMSGSTLRINNIICGMLLTVKVKGNSGRVLRQDYLFDTVSKYFILSEKEIARQKILADVEMYEDYEEVTRYNYNERANFSVYEPDGGTEIRTWEEQERQGLRPYQLMYKWKKFLVKYPDDVEGKKELEKWTERRDQEYADAMGRQMALENSKYYFRFKMRTIAEKVYTRDRVKAEIEKAFEELIEETNEIYYPFKSDARDRWANIPLSQDDIDDEKKTMDYLKKIAKCRQKSCKKSKCNKGNCGKVEIYGVSMYVASCAHWKMKKYLKFKDRLMDCGEKVTNY
jgi:hypothetical protein